MLDGHRLRVIIIIIIIIIIIVIIIINIVIISNENNDNNNIIIEQNQTNVRSNNIYGSSEFLFGLATHGWRKRWTATG